MKKEEDHLFGECVAVHSEKSLQVIEERYVVAENSNPTNKVIRVSFDKESVSI